MKMSMPIVRLFAGLGLAASLFLGCQNLLDQSGKDAAADPATGDDVALRLSIKDDSACKERWSVILDARTGGHADSAAEASFLATCVKEVKAADKHVPVIPPALIPDPKTRCHWIVSQIEAGRDEMTVSYKRYCPEDCRKLEAGDSLRHEKLCHEPGKDPFPKPPLDSLPKPPKDTVYNHSTEDTCKLIQEKLAQVKPGEPGRAELEHRYMGMCKEWIPIDSLPKPPLDTLPRLPKDTVVLPPLPKDTIVKPPLTRDSLCMDLKLRMSASGANLPELEKQFKDKCVDPEPPVAPVPGAECDGLRAKLAIVDSASADYARLKTAIGEHCKE